MITKYKTIKQIKEDLPDVMIETPQGIFKYRTCGRLNNYATTRLGSSSYEFSWYAIQRAVNNGTTLKV